MTRIEYEILPVSALKTELKNESRDLFDFDIQLKQNNAYLYYLKSGKVILLPNGFRDESNGILFHDKKVYTKYASIDSFPIENEIITIEQLFQSEILNVENGVPSIISYLSNLWGTDSSTNDIKQILLKSQERVGRAKSSHKENMYASLMLGEYIRQSVKGRWILLKEYGTFNPFYTPAILNDKNFIIVLSQVTNSFFSGGISIEDYIKAPFIQDPSLKFKSERFKNYADYKLI
jgi:hypothetical protein